MRPSPRVPGGQGSRTRMENSTFVHVLQQQQQQQQIQKMLGPPQFMPYPNHFIPLPLQPQSKLDSKPQKINSLSKY